MTIKNILFSFKGRISRKDYWIGYLINSLIFFVPFIILAIFAAAEVTNSIATDKIGEPYASTPEWTQFAKDATLKAIATLIIIPFLITGIWSALAILAKRLHDLNLSAWFIIILILSGLVLAGIPYIIATIILGFIKGTIGPNKYGPDPLPLTNN